MELYAQYIKERLGLELISTEYGWISYKIIADECFASDLFVAADARRKGEGTRLMNELIKQALKNNCAVITGNIHLFDPNADGTLRGLLAVGFKVVGANNDVLLLSKKITED